MMPRLALLWAVAGGGAAWMLHLFAGYFLVAIGCSRSWSALGATLAAVTTLCAAGSLGVTIGAWRRRRRTRRASDDGDASRLLLSIATLLGVLFALMILLGGLTVAALPPCQAGIAGSR